MDLKLWYQTGPTGTTGRRYPSCERYMGGSDEAEKGEEEDEEKAYCVSIPLQPAIFNLQSSKKSLLCIPTRRRISSHMLYYYLSRRVYTFE